MAIANYYEQKPLIIFTFKKLCNGEQRLAAQHMEDKDEKRPLSVCRRNRIVFAVTL